MLCSVSRICNWLKTPVSLRSVYSSSTSFISTKVHLVPRRALNIKANSHDNLFEYTSGRWAFNEALRLAERRLVFNVEGLLQLAAQSVGQSLADVVNISKLAEGGFNRTFLIALRDGFQMVARIPYPLTVPKFYAVASEVATMEFLRSSGLPVPRVFGYAPTSDNAAKTEYIFMEFVRGPKLTDVWPELRESDIISILRQLTQLESQMMSINFPAGGSLYYPHDLDKVSKASIPLKDKRFCVGPDTRLIMWYGRRSLLDVDRGPYESVEAALAAPAHKELAYLKQFGQPLLPFRRERREGYQFKVQPPSAHIENLKRYLLIAPSLVPKNPTLRHFRIRHPDLQPSNVIVQRSSDSGWHVTSLLDWQHASILPLFLLAGVPQLFQNHNDPVSQAMALPSLPVNFDKLDEKQRTQAEAVYSDRLIHYHYVKNTEELNKPHYNAFTDPLCVLRSRLFDRSGHPWEGETLELKLDLIRATERWEALTGSGERTPCPVIFDASDIRETIELDKEQRDADEIFEGWQNMLGFASEGWMPRERYEEGMALCKEMKERVLAQVETEDERANVRAHWPWDDMDEEKYM